MTALADASGVDPVTTILRIGGAIAVCTVITWALLGVVWGQINAARTEAAVGLESLKASVEARYKEQTKDLNNLSIEVAVLRERVADCESDRPGAGRNRR